MGQTYLVCCDPMKSSWCPGKMLKVGMICFPFWTTPPKKQRKTFSWELSFWYSEICNKNDLVLHLYKTKKDVLPQHNPSWAESAVYSWKEDRNVAVCVFDSRACYLGWPLWQWTDWMETYGLYVYIELLLPWVNPLIKRTCKKVVLINVA